MPTFRTVACLLAVLAALGCRRPDPLPALPSPDDAGIRASLSLPAETRADFLAGFQNGAAMVTTALREHHKPFLLRAGAPAAQARPRGPLPEGARVVEAPPAPELDPATGLEMKAPVGDPGSPFARGQEAGFRWALGGFAPELSRAGLVKERRLPEPPADWQRWSPGKARTPVAGGGRAGEVAWDAEILAWATAVKGFPEERRWRAFPGGSCPEWVALGPDALWVETREAGVLALDLDTGAVLRVLPRRDHAGEQGFATYEDYVATERQKLREPEAARRLADLRKRAAGGEAEAMYQIARALVADDQDPDGLTGKLVWFLEAARRGHVRAMLEVASFYYAGRCVPQDVAEARRWMDRAAATGDRDAALARSFMFPESTPVKP